MSKEGAAQCFSPLKLRIKNKTQAPPSLDIGHSPAALGVFTKCNFGRYFRHGHSLVCVLGENTKHCGKP